MIACLRWGIGFWLCLLTSYVGAWSKDYQSQYLLGDNDSRLGAKQNALAQIQLQASQEAGAYIQGSTTLVNDRLEERINQLSSAIVKVTVLAEHFELTANGQQRLWLTARATVDESMLHQQILAHQQPAGSPPTASASEPMLSVLQEQQQKLAQDNQLLRQQLQRLSRQLAGPETAMSEATNNRHQSTQNLIPESVSAVNTRLAAVEAADNQMVKSTSMDEMTAWLADLTARWQQTPVQAKVVAQKPGGDGAYYDLAVQVDWQLALTGGSPLAELCQRWTCKLGYAYKSTFNDANLTPLHQQLFRPVSRLAHIDDKYINHWRLLTVQAYPPESLTAKEQQNLIGFLAGQRLVVRTGVADQSFDLPLFYYDGESGALVIRLAGAMTTFSTDVYDSNTRSGGFLCAMNYSKQSCADGDLSHFVLYKLRMPTAVVQQGSRLAAQVVQSL